MSDPTTEMGEGDSEFPRTLWSLIERAKDATQPGHEEALNTLVRIYWKPVYYYIRKQWQKSNENSKDLAQAFLSYVLLEHASLSKVDQEKGTFHDWLRACLENFLRNQKDRDEALKRHPMGRNIFSLDYFTKEDESDLDLEDYRSAADMAKEALRRTVVEETLRRLEEKHTKENKLLAFRIYEAYELSDDREITYEALASRFGVKKTDVTNWLAQARRDFHVLAKQVLRDIGEDLDELFGKGVG